MPGTATAQVDGTWTGPGNEWTTGANWSSNPDVPTRVATFTDNGAPTSVFISDNASVEILEFEDLAPAYTFTVRDNATFTIVGGTDNNFPTAPAFRVDAGATLRIGDDAFVEISSLGDGASGGGAVVIGPSGPGSSLLSIAGDDSSTFSGTISGSGGLEFDGNGITTLTGASNGGNIGTLNGDVILCNCDAGGLTISGGSFTVEGLIGVAVGGGTLSVVDGGSLQITNGNLPIFGSMVVSGPGSSVTVAGITGVGGFAPATLEIGNGGTLTSQQGAEIDALFGGTPTATVSGPGSTWNIGGFGLAVGGGSTGGLGALTVADGGTVNVGGPMTIGDAIDGSSLALVTGAGSTVNVTGPLLVGDPCNCLVGTLAIADGGVVNATGPTGIDTGSTLNLGTGGLAGALNTPAIVNDGRILANFTDTLTLAADISGAGSLAKAGPGTLILTGDNTYSGGTTLEGGGLIVNGSLAGAVTVNGGTIGGSGAIGSLVMNAGIIAPGNSIGTFTVNGNFTQGAGTVYQVEANAAGQSDRIDVGGMATVGGTVQVLAQPGNYGASTTYTILNAAGGLTGTYAGVTSNFAFLTPSLSYDPNNVFLTLALQQNAFSAGGITPNQKAVGWALDATFAGASGDFATVLNAIAGLSTAQGPAALDAISGQPWADFGTMNVNNSTLFMNAVGQQMANARTAAAGGQRVALAQACDVAACDAAGPWSAWISALGGLGSVIGDGNASTLTYNVGGVAVGADYRVDPRILLGLGVGYTHGTQWVNGFPGRGWSDSVSVAAYGSFTHAGFYADALAGYAYFNNQLQRQIQIPGLQPRTANGSTGASQFLGQIETGYRFGFQIPAPATVTPFARFQAVSGTQDSFSEWGGDSLSLNVRQQTTNALRTTIGAELGSSIVIGDERSLDLALRLGWQHEFAYTGRPITAAFAGAPATAFTVYGATPQPDSAVLGFQARTAVTEALQLYLRYDGEVGNGTDNHALSLGARFSW